MQFYRMPHQCSHDLVDFHMEPHYVQIDDRHCGELRMHYFDERP